MSAFLVLTWTCGGLLAGQPAAQAADASVRAQPSVGPSMAEALPVQVVAPLPVGKGAPLNPSLAAECDPLGTPVQCFTPPANPSTGTYLNVASFFDRRRLSLETHFFLKYFENASAAAVEITGLGMYFESNHADLQSILGAGVVRTARANPALPLSSDLKNLQAVSIPIAAKGVETCVEFDSAVRLEADEAAWLIVRFPAAPLNSFIGLLSDTDATDEDCDYLTPDGGEMYFRPDPRNGPAYDWAITAYTRAVTGKFVATQPWTQVKLLYRDTDAAASQ